LQKELTKFLEEATPEAESSQPNTPDLCMMPKMEEPLIEDVDKISDKNESAEFLVISKMPIQPSRFKQETKDPIKITV
jgi:hypothetical protein